MPEITKQTEPRPSLLLAVFFSGLALALAASKGYLPSFIGSLGSTLTVWAVPWYTARAWYLRNDKG